MYTCKICNKKFANKCQLGGHIVWAHNNPMKRPEIAAKVSKVLKERKCPWATGKNNYMHRPEMRVRMIGDNNPMRRPEVAKKVSEKLKGKLRLDLRCKRSLEWRTNISKAHKGINKPWLLGEKNPSKRQEVRKKISKAMMGENNPMSNMQYREKAIRNSMLSNHIKPNKKELQLSSILQELQPNEWQFVGDGKVIIEGFCPDFINVNGKKLVIEFNGEYWHRNSQERDQRKIEAYASKGFETLTIWENELNDVKEIKSKIIKFGENYE